MFQTEPNQTEKTSVFSVRLKKNRTLSLIKLVNISAELSPSDLTNVTLLHLLHYIKSFFFCTHTPIQVYQISLAQILLAHFLYFSVIFKICPQFHFTTTQSDRNLANREQECEGSRVAGRQVAGDEREWRPKAVLSRLTINISL